MPSLRGSLDLWGSATEPCRWCGAPTATRLAPIDRAEPIPLHAVCGAELIWLYHDLLAGRPIPDEVRTRLRLLAQPGGS
jgi:hypothetical protein